MTNSILFLVLVCLIMLVVAMSGLRRREPMWVIAGEVVGFGLLAFGIRWAAAIGQEALLAAFLAGAGSAVWAQAEHLAWLRGRPG